MESDLKYYKGEYIIYFFGFQDFKLNDQNKDDILQDFGFFTLKFKCVTKIVKFRYLSLKEIH